MNNKFIPILVCFYDDFAYRFRLFTVLLAQRILCFLEQEFSNKVHIALENSAKKSKKEIEFNKYNENLKILIKALTSKKNLPFLPFNNPRLSKQNHTVFWENDCRETRHSYFKKEIVLPSLNSTKDEGLFIVSKTPTAPQIITSAQAKT